MADKTASSVTMDVVPTGLLVHLTVNDIKPSANNPRLLFDEAELEALKRNIRVHGVLVPLTVYQPKGQKRYSILDGERRFRCVSDLVAIGLTIPIPANVVQPPDPISGLLYMFSIHNFREQWELMPTALGLRQVMDTLGTTDSRELNKLTGLSDPQIERCKKLLAFPEKYQKMSLDPEPKTRIPSNFWIEAKPVIDLCVTDIPALAKQGDDFVTDKLVEKYRAGAIKSVIHFRRLMEAYDLTAENEGARHKVTETIQRFVMNPQLETRAAFDDFIRDNRRIQAVVKACEGFMSTLDRSHLEFVGDDEDRASIHGALSGVREYLSQLIAKLEGTDAPLFQEGDDAE
jgi:ParB/RepB/Spo0J family partition protein